jgi:hypothetical protein
MHTLRLEGIAFSFMQALGAMFCPKVQVFSINDLYYPIYLFMSREKGDARIHNLTAEPVIS